MILYLYSKCSTCQSALTFLNQNKVTFTRREITLTPPSIEELHRMLNHVGGSLSKLFNTSGQLYREMELSRLLKEMPMQQAIELLSQHGMLVKRPFLLADQFGLTGFNVAVWSNTLLSS